MKTKFIFVVILAVIMVIPGKIWSQRTKKKREVRIETIDGTVLTGKVKKQNDNYILLISKNIGEFKVYKDKIRKIEYLDESEFTDFIKPHGHKDNRSRYFITSSAYNLRKGETFYSNTWIFFNDINYGLTNNFSIGGGIIPLFLFNGADSPIWVSAKLSLPIVKNKFNISTGLSGWTVLGDETDIEAAMAANVTATIGSPINNGSLSIYILFNEKGVSEPLLDLKGKFKISSRSFIMGEMYFFVEDDKFFPGAFLGLIGMRTMFMGGLDLDYGLFVPVGDEGNILLPYLGIHINL